MKKRTAFIIAIFFLFFKTGLCQTNHLLLDKIKQDIQLLMPGLTNWQNVSTSVMLTQGTGMRTREDSFALVTFPDKNRIYFRENTQLNFDSVDYTNRNMLITFSRGVAILDISREGDQRWDVTIDGVLARIKMDTAVVIIKNLHNSLIVSVLEGSARVFTRENKEIDITEGFGIEISQDLFTSGPFPLPPPPVPEFPDDNSIITPGLTLKWSKIEGAILYRLEIALDEDFVFIVSHKEVKENVFNIGKLPEGQYLWRVCGINRNNLEGAFFDHNQFILQKSYTSLLIKTDDDELPAGEAVMEEDAVGGVVLSALIVVSFILLFLI
ncbi:MAG: FecR domain-containing protein [Spirochaetes bacterium]|nr:FecR domain-containing protein [Spirochaetota bacterium]